jgi:hypothetical protein
MSGSPDTELPEGWDALSRADSEALAPPAGAKDRVRLQLVATLGVAAGLGAAGAAGSATAAAAAAGAGAAAGSGSAPTALAGVSTALLLKKVVVVGVVAVTAVTGGTAAYVEVRAQRQETTRRALQAHPVAPAAPSLPIDPGPRAVEPAVEPTPAPEPLRPAETLGDERALLDQARGAIARSRLAEAQALLVQHAATYPQGTLAEEREALQIRLLVRQGRGSEATHRAALFRRQHPHSIQLPVIDEALRGRR